MQLFNLERGNGPLIVDVPHAGIELPPSIAARLSDAARAVPDTDWHVEKLYAFAPAEGVTLMSATQSRYVVDLNRDPSGAALYKGADNTELVPTRTFANEAIYAGDPPASAEIETRIATHFTPYHDALAAEVERVRAAHGFAIVLDGHSITSVVPRFFEGRLPDLNLGTASGTSCAPELGSSAAAVLASARPFTHVVNGRFKGGWITRRYGRPVENVHALQLEIAQACYMDEAPPYPWDPRRASALGEVLRKLVATLNDWRPSP